MVRFREGGEEVERVDVGRKAIACALGGSERRTLFMLTSQTTEASKSLGLRSARIEAIRVEIPGAGLP